MRIYKLTHLAHHLNAALGCGEFHDITYQDVWRHIDDGTIFEFLSDRLGIAVPLSALQPVDRLELMLDWDNLRGCVEPFPFDGHRNGLCLLVGYLLEGIARRSQDRNYRLTLETCGRAVPGGELNSSVGASPLEE
jgi:hypothetical protein